MALLPLFNLKGVPAKYCFSKFFQKQKGHDLILVVRKMALANYKQIKNKVMFRVRTLNRLGANSDEI